MTPGELITNSRCFKCIPNGMQSGVILYLLGQWANNLTPPVATIHWTPESAVAGWQDSGGGHNGDLATFLATADIPTVNNLSLDFATTGVHITELSNLITLPALQVLACNNNPALDIDVAGCSSLNTVVCFDCNISLLDFSSTTNLQQVVAGQNPNLTSVILTGCTQLLDFDCPDCPLLTSIPGISGNTLLNQFFSDNSGITGVLDFTGFANVDPISCPGNTNLTQLIATNCTSCTDIDCSGCTSLTTLTLTGCTALVTLVCDNCTSLTAIVDLTDCSSLDSLSSVASPIGSLDFSGSTNVTSIDCSAGNSVTSLNLTGCTKLAWLNCHDNLLNALTVPVTTVPIQVLCYANAPMLSLVLTGCTNLVSIDLNGCSNLPSLDVSTCTSLTNIDCSSCFALTSITLNTAISTLNCGFCSLSTISITAATALSVFQIPSNVLTLLAVNTILFDLDSNGVLGGLVDTSGQVPPRVPDAGPPDGATAAGNLSGKGWAVTTDV